MSDAFCTKIERAPYRFWPRRLACMRGQPQGVLRGVSVDFAEQLRPGLGFVATDAKSDYPAIFVLDRLLGYALRFFCPELTDGIEDP
jgi:hypothetical protein